MSDALFDARPFRLLTVVDCRSAKGLVTVPRADFRAFDVVEVLDRLLTSAASECVSGGQDGLGHDQPGPAKNYWAHRAQDFTGTCRATR